MHSHEAEADHRIILNSKGNYQLKKNMKWELLLVKVQQL